MSRPRTFPEKRNSALRLQLVRDAMNSERAPPTVVGKQLGTWKALQLFWFLLHYACGLAGVVAAVLASKFEWWLWGIIAAVSTAVVTFLGPLQKGDSYKHAYYRLSSAVARFQSVPSVDVEWLLEEHKHSQQMVLNQDTKPTLRQAA